MAGSVGLVYYWIDSMFIPWWQINPDHQAFTSPLSGRCSARNSSTVFPMWLLACLTIKNTSTGIIPARTRTTIYQCYTHSQVCPSPTYQLEYVIRHALDLEHYNNHTRVYMRYTRSTVRFGGCGLGLAMIMMMMMISSPGKPQGLAAILNTAYDAPL